MNLLPSFEVDFLVESKPVARRLHDAGLHVTAADLMRFIDALRDGVLLTPELTEAFFTPQVTFDDGAGQGFGLEFRENMWWKEGINAGVSGIIRHWGETNGPGVDGVVLSNTEAGAWPVIDELDRRARRGTR